MSWIIITVILYLLAIKIYKRFTSPFTLPVLTVTTIMICLLLTLEISHDYYKENGGKWLSDLLNPAIVALAIPLFKERNILIKNFYRYLQGW